MRLSLPLSNLPLALSFAVLAILGSGYFTDAAAQSDPEEFAQSILVVDTHVDVPYRLRDKWDDVTAATESGDFDFPRARKGGLDVPFMSIYTPASSEDDGTAHQLANELIDGMEALVGRAPDKFSMVYSAQEAKAIIDTNKIGIALGMENGAPIAGDLNNVDHFFERGVRYITLAHSKSNHISDSSFDPERPWGGLSPFGKQVVERMNKLGVMIDVSHLSDAAFFDVLEHTQSPVIASHSSLRYFTPGFERNMSDEMVKALAKNGGVIQINFGSSFITKDAHQWYVNLTAARDAHLAELEGEAKAAARDTFTKQYFKDHPFPYAKLDDVVAHFVRTIELVGVEHVGIGSDYDGVGDSLPEGLKDVATYPALFAKLRQHGLTDSDLEKIASGNLLRVWSENERIAAAAR